MGWVALWRLGFRPKFMKKIAQSLINDVERKLRLNGKGNSTKVVVQEKVVLMVRRNIGRWFMQEGGI